MGDKEDGLEAVAKMFILAAAVVAIAPWLSLIGLAWLLSPRTGGWGPWPHYLGGGWFLIIVALLLLMMYRARR